MALGYSLPRWGADGDLGDETLRALAGFLGDHGDGYADDDSAVVSDLELSLIRRVYDANIQPVSPPGRIFYDLRRDSDPKNAHERRSWTSITGVTIHQCACDFGHERPERWNTLWAHMGASREGNAFLVHELERVVWHGHGFNRVDVGLELEGLYAGIAGHPDGSTKPETPTPELITAGQDCIRYIFETVKRHGGMLRHLHAHRQSKDSRRADPGQELWQAVALPMMAELGLDDGGHGYCIGSGRPIPEAWDPRHIGSAY